MKSQSFYISQAIKLLRPNAEFVFNNDDYSTIEWQVLDGSAPTKAEIDAAIKEIEADETNRQAAIDAKKQEVLAKLGLTADEVAALLA